MQYGVRLQNWNFELTFEWTYHQPVDNEHTLSIYKYGPTEHILLHKIRHVQINNKYKNLQLNIT
jgi:hypothetical protein